jgi:AcrR family transcriptional regulator
MPAKPTQKHESRKREILSICVDTFVEKGFHRTSMRDLCSALSMSPGGLYRYFSSKEEIIEEMIRRDQTLLENAFVEIPTDSSFKSILRKMHAIGSQIFGDKKSLSFYNQLYAEASVNPIVANVLKRQSDSITDRLELVVRRGQQRGEIIGSYDPRVLAIFIMSSFDGLAPRATVDGEFDWEKASETFIELILRTLTIETPAS